MWHVSSLDLGVCVQFAMLLMIQLMPLTSAMQLHCVALQLRQYIYVLCMQYTVARVSSLLHLLQD